MTSKSELKDEPRVLLIAEEANPRMVSVPLEGWSHSQAISKCVKAHVVTQIRNRDAFLETGLVEGKDFTAIDSEIIAAPAYRFATMLRGGKGKAWTLNTAIKTLAYPYFERLVWKQFKEDLQAGKYNIVHRLTPLSPTAPSRLSRRCAKLGVPFVLGPLNGGVPWPKHFDDRRRQECEWLSYIRGAYRFLPNYRATRRHAAAMIIGSSDTFDQVEPAYRGKCFYIPENAIDPQRFTEVRGHEAVLPLRAVFVGRLVPYKGADMLIEAAAPLIRDGKMTLQVIGEGPQRPQLERLITEHRIADGCELAGWIDHAKLHEHLAKADLFTFPSVREFGGAVVLEAMATGLVPVVLAYGGPKELVTETTGIALPMAKPESVIISMRQALEQFVDEPWRIDRMSVAARQRVLTHFTWDAKAAMTECVYQYLLGNETSRPPMPMPIPDEPSVLAPHVVPE